MHLVLNVGVECLYALQVGTRDRSGSCLYAPRRKNKITVPDTLLPPLMIEMGPS